MYLHSLMNSYWKTMYASQKEYKEERFICPSPIDIITVLKIQPRPRPVKIGSLL